MDVEKWDGVECKTILKRELHKARCYPLTEAGQILMILLLLYHVLKDVIW